MIDYTKLKINDIKQMIIDAGHLTKEELDIRTRHLKGKTQWVEYHKTLHEDAIVPPAELPTIPETYVFSTEEELDENMVDDEAIVEPADAPPATPRYYDPEWQDYVLAQFTPGTELVKDRKTGKEYPTVNGLRRVVELLLGEIVEAGPTRLESTMQPDIPGKAVVEYSIAIEWKLNAGPYIDLVEDKPHLPVKVFRSVASAWHGNTDDMFAVFPEAIAETRAEARALRRALRLGVVSSDELTNKDTAEIVKQYKERSDKPTDGAWEEDSLITDNQISSIKLLCNRSKINIDKFINSGSKTYSDIVEISRSTAANMIKRLNQYQNNNSVEIPIDLLEN